LTHVVNIAFGALPVVLLVWLTGNDIL